MNKPIILERTEFPEPVNFGRGGAKNEGRSGEMGVALGKLAQEDRHFRVRTGRESGQTEIISGMGELH